MGYPTRDEAWELLTEHTSGESLIKHALAVEAAMRAYARRFGEDEERWGVVGLLHDFDYERHPTLEEHPLKGAEILRARGCPEEMVQAVLSHAAHTGVARETLMARALFAVDELAGFVTAVALVRPSRKVAEVEPSSVKKKMKDKAFARAVNREEIREGPALLGVDFDEHVRLVVGAMAGIARELGLAGE
ncbi:MAG: HDIG domain-containing protein [Candidatus Eisenbacteria bacterium]|uniref:HDIG domain-containing protein n=1 Tax=Eiseniibacteriota bacterium TaxID=2212470 RepID=A0A937X9V8_UNCEI|nr:HDIG domain-containing protein [Candidatus Eisenbacteria bacterium]